VRPRLDPYPTALARFRPTPLQAASWGAWRGLAIGAGLAVAMLALAVGIRSGWGAVAAVIVPVTAGVVVGAAGGLARGPRVGVDVDDVGLHRRPPAPPGLVDWTEIVDIRAERRGARTVVAVYLDSGVVSRLPAPYHGRWLGADPQFEWKLFTLRNLWATHRSWGPR
jgi:hypothetical protein